MDSPEPLMLALLNVPAVVVVKYTVCCTLYPPTGAVMVTGFGDHVIPVAVPLPFTERLTVMVTGLLFESVTYTYPVVPVVSEFIYAGLAAIVAVTEPEVK
jgi:hypothetical protein